MTRETVQTDLFAILLKNFKVDPAAIVDATPMDQLGLDSLDVIDMIVFIHQKFDYRCELNDYRAANTLGELVDFVHLKVSSKAAS
jgi:acyl carrier protein